MKNLPRLFRCKAVLILSFFAFAQTLLAQKVAITFDDLPLNGDLPPGMSRVEVVGNTLAVLKMRHVPAAYGFVNAKKLEGNADAAAALKLWADAEPVGNHTYAHMDLNANPPEAFEREIEEDEPVLELVAAKDANWHWLRYPFLREGETVEKRRAVRAVLQAHQYRVAQVTLDWEDYMWNSAYARCVVKNDAKSIAWLRTSYLTTASAYLDAGRELATAGVRARHQSCVVAASGGIQQHDSAGRAGFVAEEGIPTGDAGGGRERSRVCHRSGCRIKVRRHVAGAVDGHEEDQVSGSGGETV